jgi:SAM-dependent methyltransferase
LTSNGEFLPHLYAMDHTGGWNAGMRQITAALLDGIGAVEGPVLELGCGGGAQAALLARRFAPQPIYALDIMPAAVAAAHEHLGAAVGVMQSDVHALPFADTALGLVVGMDVLDQIGVDIVAALGELRRVLRDDGRLLLRVSAYDWLTGPHDRAFNTAHRYGGRELTAVLTYAGFAVERLTFANTLLAPPLAAVRLLQRFGVLPFAAETYDSPTANRLFGVALAWEAAWLRRRNLGYGISLYALARRQRYERPVAP